MSVTKKVIIVIAAITIAAALWFFYFRKESSAVEYKTVKVEKGDIQISVSATGTVNALSTVLVGTQVSGTISKIYVDFNSFVKKDQVIAELDKTYLMASLEDASAALEKSKILVDQYKREYDRNKPLYEEKVLSQVDYNLALFNYETAVTTYRSSLAQYNRALINLKYATIKAPISGVITSRSVDVGQTVAASFNTPTLFTIANDLTKMQVQASVDEADIGVVKEGQLVNFSVDAYPDITFGGKVNQIRLQPTTVQNVVTYTVIVDVQNPDKKLLPGMTANITIVIREKANVLKVPISAFKFSPSEEVLAEYFKTLPDSVKEKIKARPKKSSEEKTIKEGGFARIWINTDKGVKNIKVKTGMNDGSFVEVEGDIKEGDEVITGTASSSQQSTSTTQNPFVPQMRPQRRM